MGRHKEGGGEEEREEEEGRGKKRGEEANWGLEEANRTER